MTVVFLVVSILFLQNACADQDIPDREDLNSIILDGQVIDDSLFIMNGGTITININNDNDDVVLYVPEGYDLVKADMYAESIVVISEKYLWLFETERGVQYVFKDVERLTIQLRVSD
ncbi:hypothetical protein ACFLRF_01280 [Candidatus Altiarchaeota archaeon]